MFRIWLSSTQIPFLPVLLIPNNSLIKSVNFFRNWRKNQFVNIIAKTWSSSAEKYWDKSLWRFSDALKVAYLKLTISNIVSLMVVSLLQRLVTSNVRNFSSLSWQLRIRFLSTCFTGKPFENARISKASEWGIEQVAKHKLKLKIFFLLLKENLHIYTKCYEEVQKKQQSDEWSVVNPLWIGLCQTIETANQIFG